MERKILHFDLDAFFCSVEELLNPALKGKPFVVGGSAQGRGVVASCSYAARHFGIHSAMPMKRALAILPTLILVKGNYQEYSRKSDEVMNILGQVTPLVEQISIDEAFLDVTDLSESSDLIAKKLQNEILKKTNLPASIGGASNKLVAKIANNVGKAAKHGLVAPLSIKIIPTGQEASFLAYLPIREMWGIGEKTAQRLKYVGIHTIGDLSERPQNELVSVFGNYAATLQMRAKGIDKRPVGNTNEIKSISNEITFCEDLSDHQELLRVIRRLSEKVAVRLRQKSLAGNTVRIKIRWPGFETHTYQTSLKQATHQDSIIFSSASQLFESIRRPGQPVRLIGVGVTHLEESVNQLNLFEKKTEKEEKLLNALDELNERFGQKTIMRADQLSDKEIL